MSMPLDIRYPCQRDRKIEGQLYCVCGALLGPSARRRSDRSESREWAPLLPCAAAFVPKVHLFFMDVINFVKNSTTNGAERGRKNGGEGYFGESLHW